MKKTIHPLTSAALALSLVLGNFHSSAWGQVWTPENSRYLSNGGPNPADPMGREMLELYRISPEAGYLSENISPAQKFRYAFGAMMFRGSFERNAIKAFAIGQDAVDDAELVKLPGTGTGYSTRVGNIMDYFGLFQSVGTSNASFQTIKGQYGSFDHYYVEIGKDGQPELKKGKYVDPHLWALMNGESSSIREHREMVWEWMIRNNPESLRLLILFGGASQDAFAEFLIRRGFRIPTRTNPDRLSSMQVPASRLTFAGGNNEFPVLLTKDGKDLFQQLLGRKLDYTKDADKAAIAEALDVKKNPELVKKAIELMAFTGGGLGNSGLVHPGQLGGYDLSRAEIQINGKWVRTNSLRGARLADGSTVAHDIAFIASPHPTALSKNISEASETVRRLFAPLEKLKENGWAIEPDLDENGKRRTSDFEEGKDFKYGRGELPKCVLPCGVPDSLAWPEVSADRIGPQIIVSEPPSTSQKAKFKIFNAEKLFDKAELEAAKKAQPVEPLNPNDLWSQHSRTDYLSADRGPGLDVQKLMHETLDRSVLEPKAGMKVVDQRGNDLTLETHGIEAYNTRSHSTLGFFAHYRGTFQKPRVFVLSDPADLDDRNTGRAATGPRGQAVNGLMRDLGVMDSQLVLKTAPVDMHGANAQEWEVVRKGTEAYREAMFERALSEGSIEAIFTDGPVAKAEMNRMLRKFGITNIPVVNIERGSETLSGIREAGAQATKLAIFRGAQISGKPAAIPPSQLPWNSRGYEGNGGPYVIESNVKGFKGKTYAVALPDFVFHQEVRPMPRTVRAIEETTREREKMGVIGPKDKVKDFLARMKRSGFFEPGALQAGKNVLKTESSSKPVREMRAQKVSCSVIFGG